MVLSQTWDATRPPSPAGAALPERSSFDLVAAGDGPLLAEGDNVELDYVVVSWPTGEVVLTSAEDFGSTHTIVLGEAEVPRILESAIFEQPVGSRVQVIYGPDLPAADRSGSSPANRAATLSQPGDHRSVVRARP